MSSVVQIDSNFRDTSQYPYPTDFAVRFDTNTSTAPNISGFPMDGLYDLSLKIDPDFSNSSFKLINGSLQNLKRDTDGNFYIAGIINVLPPGENFEIQQDNYKLILLSSSAIVTPFIAKFIPLNGFYYISWMNYLTPALSGMISTPAFRDTPSRSIFEIDTNGNVYWMFDCSYDSVNVTSTLNGSLYTINSDNSTSLRQYNIVCAFDKYGYQYSINGIPWGYHKISSNQDLKSTLENGKFNIKSNTDLKLYCTTNTNPYSPYVVSNTYSGYTGYNGMYMYPGLNGDTRLLTFGGGNGVSQRIWREFIISSDGTQTLVATSNSWNNNLNDPEYLFTNWTPQIYNSTGIYIVGGGSDDYGSSFPFYFYRWNTTTHTGTLLFTKNLLFNGSSYVSGTVSCNTVILGNYLYISTANVGGGSTYGKFSLWRLDLTNPISSNCTRIVYDTGISVGNAYFTLNSMTSNGNNIVTMMAADGNSVIINSYNVITTQYTSLTISSINGDNFTTKGSYYCLVFTGLDGLLYGFINNSYFGYLFRININSTITITYISSIPTFGFYKMYFYNTSTKAYLINEKGRLYDITNTLNPILITDQYPVPPTGKELTVQTISNNLMASIYTESNTNIKSLTTNVFIDAPTTITSSHWSKPIVNYKDTATTLYQHYESFSIPGNTSSVTTNFNPTQFIANGLLAWYKATDSNNLIITGGDIITGMLDLSGYGNDLIADNLSSCPRFTTDGLTNNQPMAVWKSSSNKYTSFTSKQPLLGSAKFVIMSFAIQYGGSSSYTTKPFQLYDLSNEYISLNTSYNGSNLTIYDTVKYTTGPISTSQTYALEPRITSPWYFGVNKPDTLAPYLAGENIINVPLGTSYVPTLNSTGAYIKLMKDLTNMVPYEYTVVFKEMIVLDFVPSQYQLSLFQTYLVSNNYIYPIVNSALAGVYSVKALPTLPSTLFFEKIDGSDVIPGFDRLDSDTVLANYVIAYPNYYRIIRHLRAPSNTYTDAPNILLTIGTDNVVRVFRFGDYLQWDPFVHYSEFNLQPYGSQIHNIDGYFDVNGDCYFFVSNYDGLYTYNKWLWKFKLEAPGPDNLNLVNAFSVPSPGTQGGGSPPWYFTPMSFRMKTYPDGKSYLFFVIGTSRGGYTRFLERSCMQAYDVTNTSQVNLIYQDPVNANNGKDASWNNNCDIVEYPDGNIYFMCRHPINGNTVFMYNITTPTSISRMADIPSLFVSGWVNTWFYYDDPPKLTPMSTFVHPISKKVYSLQNFSVNILGTRTSYISFLDYSNLNSVPGNSLMNLKFYVGTTLYNLTSNIFIRKIKAVVWNQKVWAMLCFVDSSNASVGSAFIDVSNPEYVFQNYTDNLNSTNINSSSYTNLNGIGVSIINQIDNLGKSGWLSYLGGGSSGKWAIDCNISNLETDDTLRYLYLVGSWKNKLECFVSNGSTGTLMNRITTSDLDSTFNSFLIKMNINNGYFTWVVPSFGSYDDYFERLRFMSSKSYIGVVSHFSSPVMLVYEPQTSVYGGSSFSNPVNNNLNLSNTSSITAGLIVFDTNGAIKWSSKLYTDQQATNTYLYDLTYDSDVITVIGKTNANTLYNIDGLNKSYQKLYSSIDPYTQYLIMMYSFDINGNYLKSEKIEFPAGMSVDVQDIKSFSFSNSMVFFANCNAGYTGASIKPYNKDGSLGQIVPPNYPVNKDFTQLFTYLFDSSFTDSNGKKYSQIVTTNNNNLIYYTGSLTNYKLFIQGGYIDYTPGNIVSTSLNTEPTLNSNFSIRGFTGAVLNSDLSVNSIIYLNNVISTKTIQRYNLPNWYNETWVGSISLTDLEGMITYETGTNGYTVASFYGPTPSLPVDNYYLMYTTSTGIVSNPVLSITSFRGVYTLVTQYPIYNNPTVNTAYLSQFNQNSEYTLQFYPGSLLNDTYFDVTLNTLTIPDRPVRNSSYPGVRYLTDFPYIYVVLVNTNPQNNIDNKILNNFFTTNTTRNPNALFTIPITSAGGSGNYITLSSGLKARMKFTPGFYQIRVKLFDPKGRIILFDNTPIKTSDSLFTTTVPDDLMNVSLIATFSRYS